MILSNEMIAAEIERSGGRAFRTLTEDLLRLKYYQIFPAMGIAEPINKGDYIYLFIFDKGSKPFHMKDARHWHHKLVTIFNMSVYYDR